MTRGLLGIVVTLLALGACGDSSDSNGLPGSHGWTAPEVLDNPVVFDSGAGPSLDGDGRGNAIAVWAPDTPAYPPVLARRYSAQGGWGAVETVHAGGGGSVNTPSVRMNSRGDAVSVWSGYGGVYASTCPAGGAWSPLERLGPASLDIRWGLDDLGNALVIWHLGGISWTRYEPGAGWRDAAPLPGAERDVSFDPTPTVGVASTGEAIAAWARDGVLQANAFDRIEGWGDPRSLTAGLPGEPLLSSVVLGSGGDGIVFWYQAYTEEPSLYASFRDGSTGFGGAERLGPSVGAALSAAIDPAGNALVFYMSGQGLRRQRYAVGAGWGEPESVEGAGGFAAIPIDTSGDGWIFWNERLSESDALYALRARRLDAGVPTGPVEEVPSPYSGTSWFRGTPMDAGGGILAGWFQDVSPTDEPRRTAFVTSSRTP